MVTLYGVLFHSISHIVSACLNVHHSYQLSVVQMNPNDSPSLTWISFGCTFATLKAEEQLTKAKTTSNILELYIFVPSLVKLQRILFQLTSVPRFTVSAGFLQPPNSDSIGGDGER